MLLQKIKQSCKNFPNRNAFHINGKYYTYSEFSRKIGAVKNQINQTISKNEKLIAVVAYNDIETYSSLFGVLYSGLGYVPINPSNPIDRNSFVIEQSGVQTILTSKVDDNLFSLLKNKNIKIILTSELQEAEDELQIPELNDDDIVYILFTSGSTGIPKGVPINRKNLDSLIDAFFKLDYKINEYDRFLQMFELTFDFSVMAINIPLCIGSCIYTVASEGIKYADIYNTLEDHKITFAPMVPSILTYLRPYFEELKFDKLKYSLFCGEALSSEIVKEWLKCTPNGKVVNAYGPTEATVFCLIYNWDEQTGFNKSHKGSVCIGKEMFGTKAIIIDDNYNVVNDNEEGELCLSGKQLTTGYWKNPDKNKETFFTKNINGELIQFYRTGDLTIKDSDGDYFYCGRIDFQVKIDGFRIELGEIEHFAREFSKIKNVIAIGFKNKIGTMQIHLFLERFNGSVKDLENFLRTKLPPYMIPASYSSIDEIPLNENGKIDRKILMRMINSQRDENYLNIYLPQLVESFKKYENKKSFHIEKNFFTYKELAYRLSTIRKSIDDITNFSEDVIGILTYNHIDTYASILACIFSGNAFVPINPDNPIDRNLNIIEQAEIKTIITNKFDSTNSSLLSANNLKYINTSHLLDDEINLNFINVDDNKTAYILFTSGSTGIPKGVPISRKNLFSFVDAFFALNYKIDEEDRFLQMFDLTFDLSIMSYFIPLFKGACVYTVSSQGIKYANVFNTLLDYEITFALMVPSILSYLRNYFDEILLDKMKYSLFCGEALLDDVVVEWSKCVPNAVLQNVYGPTEATIFCLTFDLPKKLATHKNMNGIVSIGKPMKNMDVIVIDENSKILSNNNKGELCLAGNQLTNGYIKNPERNKSAFLKLNVKGNEKIFYRTGDLAYLDDENDFMYCGRIDNQIKIDGFRIELSEIEHHAREFSDCTHIAAINYQNNLGITKIHLYLENYDKDLTEVENYLKSKIPAYMIPSSISSIPNFPLNVNGKIDRPALKKLFESEIKKA